MTLSLGCAGTPLSINPIPVSADPSAQVDGLAHELEEARQAKISILSPGWFAKAEQSYKDAQKTRDAGGAVQDILGDVATGRAQLSRAREFAKISATTFPAMLKARKDARASGATALGSRYSEVEKNFLAVTRAVEDDSLAWAQRKAPSVEQEFRALELTAIQETTGNRIRDLIAEARADNAGKLVPTVLAETETQYRALDTFISENRYASAEIGERANAALFQANRLVSITNEANAIQGMSTEARLLRQEGRLNEVVDSLAIAPVGDQGFDERYERVAASARELKSDRDSLVTRTDLLRGNIDELHEQVASLEGRSSEEQARLAALEDEQRFEALYNEVSAYFKPNEAEVYKQGSKLVIRLRAVNFPVGDYVLQTEDYAVLSKAQRAIRAFGDPSVVIEGHTDSTGSKELNDHLSQKRAEAVAEYLVANNTLPRQDITAIGMGFSVPLASNNTSQGRAMNRRIDVVIDPRPSAGAPAVSSEE